MFQIKDITIKNFLSVGNVSQAIKFTDDELVLVLGENLDLGGNDSRNGVGKAQPLTSKIKVPGGWSTMGEMQVGTVVSTPSGETAEVTGVYPQGLKKTYKIHFGDGRSAEACEDHLWKIYSHSFKDEYKVMSTKEIIEHNEKYKDYKNKSTYYKYVDLVSPESTHKDLPVDPYFLGAMLGDGSFSSSGMGFSTIDYEVLEHVKNTMPECIDLIQPDYVHSCDYKFKLKERKNPSPFRLIIKHLGLHGTLSDTKFIPDMYKHSSLDQKLALIQGLVDTDGYVGKQGCVSITTVSKQLAEDIQYVVRSIGGQANIALKTNCGYKNEQGEFIKCKDSYNVSIMYHTPKDLARLTRKKDRLPGENYQYRNRKLRIDNIEHIGDINSQCIMIDHPDHLYITDDFVVTHNTTVINALSYALYGEAIVKIRKDNLVNKVNQKGMMVTLDFAINNVSYRIERGRKPNVFKFYANGQEFGDEDTNEAQGDNRLTQQEIERIIGLSHTMFRQIVALNTYNEPFLSMRANDQRAIIEQLLGITKLTEKAEVLKGLVKLTRDRIKEEEFKIKAVQESNKRIEKNISSLELKSKSWERSKQAKITANKAELEELYKLDIDQEIEFHKRNAKSKELQSAISGLEKEISSLEWKKKTFVKTKERAEEKMNSTHDSKECPTCGQGLADETHEEIVAKYRKEFEDASASITECETDLAKLNAELSNVEAPNETNKTFYSSIDDAYHHKSVLDALANDLEKEIASENPYTDQIEDLVKDGLQEVDFESINEYTTLKEHQDFLLKLLTSKDSFIRKKIIDQNLMYLNSRLSSYLSKVGLPHDVKFRSDLEVEITQYGRDFDFDNLSRGERTRLILSLSWAFRDVYESLNGKVNLLFIDELIDGGLDTNGVENSLSVLKKMTRENQRCIYLISHRDELIGRVSSVLKVVKEGGFTSFETTDTNLV